MRAVLLFVCACTATDPVDTIATAVEAPIPRLVATETIRAEDAGRVAWSPVDPEVIAFDAKNPARMECADQLCFDVYIRDHGIESCITCTTAVPADRKNRGQPAFHPSGDWLVIQVEEANSNGGVVTRPGRGVRNELWLISRDGAVAFPLPYDGDAARDGVLHPHFSHDGKLLAWAEKYTTRGPGNCSLVGCWRIRIADFTFAGEPKLAVRPAYMALGDGFYETHEFLGDELLFTSSGGQGVLSSDIFALDPATLIARQLTFTDYNEHAHPSPDGAWITWMTSRDIPGTGADVWVMDAATGTRQARLTYFNNDRPLDHGLNVADHEWSPDGNRIVQYVGKNGDFGAIEILYLER